MNMNIRAMSASAIRLGQRRPYLAGLIGLVAIVLAVVLVKASRPAAQASTYYEVKRGDLLISIVEGGTLEAVNEVVIRSEVEGTARIIFIVREGSNVKKGDLLVELDSSATQDAVNQQQINVEKAQFALIQAEQQLEIQKSTVDSEVQSATLKVEFAQSDLDKYVQGEALQARRNAQIEITNVLENLKINEERLKWTEELYKKGYETKANLDRDRLSVSQTELRLEQVQQAFWMLETYDQPKKKRTLEAALKEAEENLDRIKLQGERKLAQSRADVETQKSTLDLSRKKLERELKQLEATKIYAPQDGMVVYAGSGGRYSSESMIEEGAVVRNRQELIKLPDVSTMKLQIRVHESYINQVRVGQPAFIVLDAMPDLRFRGTVRRVAPLPDSQSRWSNPNLKVYPTEILVTDPLPDVKPGVSARAEIVVTNLQNVLSVPIQAVTTRKGQQVVFLERSPTQPVPVSLGLYNVKFIEIASGLKEGDRVMLSPPFDIKEKDLAGAIVADGEKVSLPDESQRPAAALSPPVETVSVAAEARPNGTEADRPRMPDASQPEIAQRTEGSRPEGGRMSREELLKQFDTNGDGELDDSERAAMRERFGRERGGRGVSTNSAASAQGRPDASR